MEHRKLVLYISMSLDGFLAKENDDLSWLSIVEKEGEDYGYGKMMERCDAYIVGRRTYDVVLGLTGGEFPQSKMFECYVITRQEIESKSGVKFYNGDLEALVQKLKSKPGKDIYCDGGGQIVKMLMEKNLIDEYIVSVIPTVIGSGKRLFKGGINGLNIDLIESKQFESGLAQLRYKKKTNE